MSLSTSWPWIRAGEITGVIRGENPEAYLDDIFRYARARLRSREDAEDVACEVVQSLPANCRRKDLKLYMVGMARRKIVDRLRRTKNELELREIDLTGRFDDRSDDAAIIDLVLSRLSDEQREALTLKYVVGLSSAEIGSVMSRSSEAVDSLLQRGRAAFSRAWEALSGEEAKR